MTTITLTIAGSDSGGGAGIQADLKTFQELDTFGTSVITAITAQNTTGVHGVEAVSLEMIDAQMEAVCKDLRPHSLKTGMLFSDEIIALVSQKITDYQLTNVVVDPVMIAKGGASLLQEQAIQAMKEQLLPLATIVTPNLPEAEVLSGMTISSEEDIHLAAQKIAALGPAYTVIKGGHHTDPDFATDYIFQQNQLLFTVQSRRVPTQNTHGTGCTFSAAIAAGLAKKLSIKDAIIQAKAFIQAAIENDLLLGAGHGPTNHHAFKKHEELYLKQVRVESTTPT